MLGWGAKGRYRKDVLAAVGDIIVDHDGTLMRQFLKLLPGTEKAIGAGFDKRRSKDELAVTLSQIFLTHFIDKTEERARCIAIARSIREWCGNPEMVAKFLEDHS